MITLADNRRIAVRPSGTEPKIKYYMFAAEPLSDGKTILRRRAGGLPRSVLQTRSSDSGRNSKPMPTRGLPPDFVLTLLARGSTGAHPRLINRAVGPGARVFDAAL